MSASATAFRPPIYTNDDHGLLTSVHPGGVGTFAGLDPGEVQVKVTTLGPAGSEGADYAGASCQPAL